MSRGKLIRSSISKIGSEAPPTNEEANEAIIEAVEQIGIPIGAVAIQKGEWVLESASQVLPCYAAIVEASGYVLLFSATGPKGIHARVRTARQFKDLKPS